jgi:ABC-type phosphate transport system substrate-binding protein
MIARPSKSLSVRRTRGWLTLRFPAAVSALALGWLVGTPAGAQSATDGLRVIVHISNPASAVEREFLAAAFLKKATRWDDGQAIRPVDLPQVSAVRRSFSANILRRSVAAIRNYWQQRIFSGRGVPPPELDSEAAVADYVAKNPGAVGYVSGNVDRRRVKVLALK